MNLRSREVSRAVLPLEVSVPERVEGGRLADLYVRHSDRARRLAYLLTGDSALAEDLTQEAFVKLAGRYLHLRDQVAFEAYLRRTVVNLSRTHYRRAGKERVKAQRLAGLRPPALSPPDIVARDSIERALARLSDRQRAAVVLRFYEDMSERQTADVLGCRPGTVKSLISRALDILRTEIPKEEAP
jgi:RNA polymerase sigma-70 factor (sigma-E family)